MTKLDQAQALLPGEKITDSYTSDDADLFCFGELVPSPWALVSNEDARLISWVEAHELTVKMNRVMRSAGLPE